MFIQKSLDHLKDNNRTYYQHLLFAGGHGIRCLKAGFLLIIHSMMPALFPKTGSHLVNELNKSFIDHNEWIEFQSMSEKLKKT
jgi:hypothetical protein